MILSLPQRRRENETLRQCEVPQCGGEQSALNGAERRKKRVDELHETPHNLISLLLTNTTICRWVNRDRSTAEKRRIL
jgi:hypothetical protein